MLSLKTIAPTTLSLLKALMSEPALSQTRLVGGTSLALQYGHRISVDLDFFGHIDCSSQELFDILSSHGSLTILSQSQHVKVFLINDIKVDIVEYNYPWLDEPIVEDGIRLATPQDIAAMKINAIVGRGTRKDFIDLYYLLEHYKLSEIIDFFAHKYPDYNLFTVVRSLTYFDDAEATPMPMMIRKESWQEIKSHITDCVKEFLD